MKRLKRSVREYLSKIGKKGGTKSRRVLSTHDAVAMAQKKWANFHGETIYEKIPKSK